MHQTFTKMILNTNSDSCNFQTEAHINIDSKNLKIYLASTTKLERLFGAALLQFTDGLMGYNSNASAMSYISVDQQWPLLQTWFNFNPSMDK